MDEQDFRNEETIPRVLWLVPRFHTNMLGWLQSIELLGGSNRIYVTRVGKTECHDLATPQLIRTRDFRGSLARSKSRLVRGIAGLLVFPNPVDLVQVFRQTGPTSHIVFRFEFDAYSFLILSWLAIFRRQRFVLYSQHDLEGLSIVGSSGLSLLLRVLGTSSMITPNNWLTSPVPKFLRAQVIRIPFAIAQTEFGEVPQPWTERPYDVCIIGKYVRRKGHMNALIALTESSEKIGRPMSVVLAGEVLEQESEVVLQELDLFVRNHQHGLNVDIRRNQMWEETQEIIRQSRILVLYSSHEPASVSQLEAMSHGTIPIVRSGNGTAGYLEGLSTNLIVTSVTELERVVSSLMEDSRFANELSQQARHESMARYSPERVSKYWSEALPYLNRI